MINKVLSKKSKSDLWNTVMVAKKADKFNILMLNLNTFLTV